MTRLLGALGIGAVAALATAIVALLVAVLLIGTDRAVVGALVVALGGGVLATPVAWWLLGRVRRAAS
jgi:hypothetical protein